MFKIIKNMFTNNLIKIFSKGFIGISSSEIISKIHLFDFSLNEIESVLKIAVQSLIGILTIYQIFKQKKK